MSETILYVTYLVGQQQKTGHHAERSNGNVRTLFPVPQEAQFIQAQEQVVKDFFESKKWVGEKLESFTEIPENRRTNKWPQLEKALRMCQARNAVLIIPELGTLTNNETFTQLLLDSGVTFYCCDQSFVNQTNLEAFHKHAKIQKKLHGELIRKGLKMTSAKSGNPNAAEVISKVNKPKIDTAIVFAFLLQPIISDYRRKGYSQRQMVKALNEEGFTAPEGGKWVLSQLQKVLERVRLNDIALEVKSVLSELIDDDSLTETQLTEALNQKGITPLKRTTWDETQVKKLLARLEQIAEIENINRFVLNLLPVIHRYNQSNSTSEEILKDLEKAGLSVQALETSETTE